MARPTQSTMENKKKYAYAVLSGAMTRKDAYLKYINPYCRTPVKSAAQLHRTKQMAPLLEEVSAELCVVDKIKQATKDMTEQQLTLAQELLDDATDKPYREKLTLLKSIKSVQDNAIVTLKCIDDSYNKITDNTGDVRLDVNRKNRLAAKYVH